MAATKLRSSPMSLHGVFHKSRVFDPTCLYEAKGKPIIQQKCLFGSYIANYADIGYLCRTLMEMNELWHSPQEGITTVRTERRRKILRLYMEGGSTPRHAGSGHAKARPYIANSSLLTPHS